MWVVHHVGDAEISRVHHVLFPCLHKSLISLYSAFDSTVHGLYGAARPQLRLAFESLMIAKYCSVNHGSDVFDRWVDGLEVYFANAILKKIKTPSTAEFKTFWRLLCATTHSSVHGAQPDLSLREVAHELDLNFDFIALLLQCSYHLLASHIITPSMRYYANQYSDDDGILASRQRLRGIFKEQSAKFGDGTRRLLRDYRSTWAVL